MKNWLTDFFYFTSAERNGFFALLTLAFLIFISPLFFSLIWSSPTADLASFEKLRANFQFENQKEEPSGFSDFKKEKSSERYVDSPVSEFEEESFPTQNLFSFDPNKAGESDLRALGLSPKIAQRLINFRSKGGVFYKKEDLAKIYGLSQRQYEILAPYISIERKSKEVLDGKPSFEPPKETREVNIDVNRATVEDWQQLRGIGPYFAQKITAYREKLGGFASIDQIGETYKLPDSVFQKIKPFLNISPVLKKININTATPEELSAHPYISWKKANVIVNYRSNHGNYQSASDLLKTDYFTTEEVSRLAPYLDF